MSTAPADAIDRTGLPGSLDAALKALDATGSRWCLLRPRAAVARPEGDIDLLVDPSALPALPAMLADPGFVVVPIPGPDLHAATYDEAGRFVWLHLQPEIRVAGAVLPAEPVLAAVEGGDLPEPPPAWLLWILLLRALVDKGELAEHHRTRVMELAQSWNGGPEALESLARTRGIDPATAVAAAAAGDWDELMLQSVYRAAPPSPAWRRAARLPRRLLALRNMRERRGFSVAVLGPDGAGKTTLVAGLERTLPLPTWIQRMGLTSGGHRKADKLRIPGLVFAAHVTVLWFRYLRSAFHVARGEIVIFDRYPLDGAVPSGRPLTVAGKFSRKLQRRSVPVPDMVLLLDASGPTLHARSGEYDAAVLEGWRDAYGRLADQVSALEKIDAERPADQVLRDAQARVWSLYRERRSPAGG